MSSIKEKDLVMLYKKLLDPMGYMVIPKVVKRKEAPKWLPDEPEKFDAMKTIEVEQELNDAKAKLLKLDEYMVSVKEKAIEYMNSVKPTAYTEELYKGTYASNAILKSSVVIDCKLHAYCKDLIEYLEMLLLDKLNLELVIQFRKEQKGLLNMEVNRDGAQVKLKIEVE